MTGLKFFMQWKQKHSNKVSRVYLQYFPFFNDLIFFCEKNKWFILQELMPKLRIWTSDLYRIDQLSFIENGNRLCDCSQNINRTPISPYTVSGVSKFQYVFSYFLYDLIPVFVITKDVKFFFISWCLLIVQYRLYKLLLKRRAALICYNPHIPFLQP